MPDPPPDGLTVAVLTYDSAATVGDCLRSLAGQDDGDFTVLVVDDDSTDDTLAVVDAYRDRLDLTVVRNGSHSIPTGRNLAVEAATTPWVAFIDSDDTAPADWTAQIRAAVRADPDLALVFGERLPAWRTATAHAIALNDRAIRERFGGGVLQFSTCNCALNVDRLPRPVFNERFAFGEDLELFGRVRDSHRWRCVPGMRIELTSRDTLGAYARQMYAYGEAKLYTTYALRSLRPLDLAPAAVLAAGAALAARRRAAWPLLGIVAFSAAESALVVAAERPAPDVAARILPAWLVKNLAWTAGLGRGAARLAASPARRRELRASVTRAAPPFAAPPATAASAAAPAAADPVATAPPAAEPSGADSTAPPATAPPAADQAAVDPSAASAR